MRIGSGGIRVAMRRTQMPEIDALVNSGFLAGGSPDQMGEGLRLRAPTAGHRSTLYAAAETPPSRVTWVVSYVLMGLRGPAFWSAADARFRARINRDGRNRPF